MRESNLLHIRPKIPTIIEKNATSDWEIFQNKTLRPILKLQHDLLLQVFKDYIIKRKGAFYTLNQTKRLAYVEQCIRKDNRFKQYLVGIIVGQFTLLEYQTFMAQEKELMRRITDLLIQRLQSQIAVF